MDRILISAIPVCAVIGTLKHERVVPQKLILHAELFSDFTKAVEFDDFHDTFDYSAVELFLHDFTAQSSFHLLEALAGTLAERVLQEFPQICGIRLRIDKPGAPKFAACISIVTERGLCM